MVVHETVSMANPVVAFIHALKSIEKGASVLLVFENGFLFVPAGRDVINCARVFYAQRTGHKTNVAESSRNVNKIDLTPVH
jgi:predicted transcriptional regulator